MIQIHLKLFATLRSYLPDGHENYSIKEGTTAEVLIRELGIPKDHTKLIFINGRAEPLDHGLFEGDRVGIFPPVGGG